jgi:hypothetical protein
MVAVAQAAGHAMKSDHLQVLSLSSIIPVDVLARKYKKIEAVKFATGESYGLIAYAESRGF